MSVIDLSAERRKRLLSRQRDALEAIARVAHDLRNAGQHARAEEVSREYLRLAQLFSRWREETL